MNVYKYCLNFAIETVNEIKYFFNMAFSEIRYKLYVRKSLNKPLYYKNTLKKPEIAQTQTQTQMQTESESESESEIDPGSLSFCPVHTRTEVGTDLNKDSDSVRAWTSQDLDRLEQSREQIQTETQPEIKLEWEINENNNLEFRQDDENNKNNDLESVSESVSDGLSYGHESENESEDEINIRDDLNYKKRVYESDESSIISNSEIAENIYKHNINYNNCINEIKNIKKVRFE